MSLDSEEAARELERLRTEQRLAEGLNLIDPQTRAKAAVLKHRQLNDWDIDNNESYYKDLTVDDLYVYFFAYILGGWKCYVSSDKWTDTSIYEVTYSIQKEEMYLDWYTKRENVCIPDDSDYKLAQLRHKLS